MLNYGIGNLHSAHKGFSQVGADTRLTDAKRALAANGVTARPPN
ncbi:MAG: hypothetical protein OXB92_09660 [Acidimicrobiaceae bacterium]|nr:hypothetical protein [Acidimicrobiaceae bacterium]